MYNKGSVNLCSTYMLPLIGLNHKSFGENNFIGSYISETDAHLVIELKMIPPLVTNNPKFVFKFKSGDNFYAVFEVPPQFKETVKLFREGKYSKFSDEAKTMIRKKSGLRYRAIQPNGIMKTARELLALDRDSGLRKALEEELDEQIEKDAELASIPGEENFFKLNMSRSIPLSVIE